MCNPLAPLAVYSLQVDDTESRVIVILNVLLFSSCKKSTAGSKLRKGVNILIINITLGTCYLLHSESCSAIAYPKIINFVLTPTNFDQSVSRKSIKQNLFREFLVVGILSQNRIKGVENLFKTGVICCNTEEAIHKDGNCPERILPNLGSRQRSHFWSCRCTHIRGCFSSAHPLQCPLRTRLQRRAHKVYPHSSCKTDFLLSADTLDYTPKKSKALTQW